MDNKLKILILDGCKNSGMGNLAGILPNESKVISIQISEHNILDCTGCMSCVWNMDKMNPGYCRLDDDMKLIYPTFIHSDLVILITDIVFGGFSFQIKKVIDRLLPALFTAPLKKRGDDVGHIMRYRKRPAILGIGIQKEKNQETEVIFKEHIDRLSALWNVPYRDSFVYHLNSDSQFRGQLIKITINNWMSTLQ